MSRIFKHAFGLLPIRDFNNLRFLILKQLLELSAQIPVIVL